MSAFYQSLIVKQRTVPVFNAEIYKFNLWSLHKRELGVMKQSKPDNKRCVFLALNACHELPFPIHYLSTRPSLRIFFDCGTGAADST